jgi:hypothetical protein
MLDLAVELHTLVPHVIRPAFASWQSEEAATYETPGAGNCSVANPN